MKINENAINFLITGNNFWAFSRNIFKTSGQTKFICNKFKVLKLRMRRSADTIAWRLADNIWKC